MTNLFFIFLLFISGMVACQAENEPIAAPIEQQVTIAITRVTETPTLTATLTHPTVAPQNTPTQVTATPTVPPQGTPGFGSLTVDSNLPDALVYVNQNQVGQTPYQGYWPAGTYTITVSLPGFQPWQQQISLSDLQSQQLTSDFSFTPKIEQLLDTLIDVFWWAEDGNAIYYVKCSDTGCQYDDRHEQNNIPIWKLDLNTRESTQVNDSWPPTWIPREYAPLIPSTISGYWVHMSPSGEKALYFEKVVTLPPLTPDPFNEPPQDYIFNVYIILDDSTVISLGKMGGAPSQRISWSADEQLILIPTEPMIPGRYGGWLINLNDNTLSPVEPPIPTETRINLTTSIIWPDGKAILWDDIIRDQVYLWYFLESEPTLIPINFKRPLGWLSDNYIFTYDNEVNYVWYDVVNGISKTIIAGSDLPGSLSAINVQKDQGLLQFYSIEGRVPGLWLLTFDTE